MIEIREDQMQMFAEMDRTAFVRRAAAYLRATHGDALPLPEEAELEELIRRQSLAARGYGLQAEAEVLQFIEIGLAFGEDFHCSRKYAAAEEILRSKQDGARKIRALLAAAEAGFGTEA